MDKDVVYVVIDLVVVEGIQKEKIAGASIHEVTARMIAASVEEGHSRFIEAYENGNKVAEFGYREESKQDDDGDWTITPGIDWSKDAPAE